MSTAVQPSRAPGSLPIDVFVDFDGTIAPDDATDSLLAKFADPFWLEIEAEWQSGKITSAEAMDRQIRLIRATPEQIDEFIAGQRRGVVTGPRADVEHRRGPVRNEMQDRRMDLREG